MTLTRTTAVTPSDPREMRRQRAVGSLVGAAVGDALGAPFEFGPAGAFSRRFPSPALGSSTEMVGGGGFGWEPGEWTDDTQMAMCVAASLLDRGDLDLADVFARFRAWYEAHPPDVGNTTAAVLGSSSPWQDAAAEHFRRTRHGAGNGGLMRTTPAAIRFAAAGREATMDAGRRLTLLTHGDPAAGEGSAIHHELIRVALNGDDPLAAVEETLGLVAPEHRAIWDEVLAPSWTPAHARVPNGVAWPTLGTALWALRTTTTFTDALRAAVDVGGDTDTVACVTGALAGARYGIQAIPSRWTTYLNGHIPGNPPLGTTLADLQRVALALLGEPAAPLPGDSCGTGVLGPTEVLPGFWVGNVDALATAPQDHAVLSLCRTPEPSRHPHRRSVYLIDKPESNPGLDTVLADVLDEIAAFRTEGRDVFVHCFGGSSRTGLVLRGWLRRSEGLSAAAATARAQQLWPSIGLWQPEFDAALERLST
jgi:ADP-ribosyl-[dinitrogen reductase] hydrolase